MWRQRGHSSRSRRAGRQRQQAASCPGSGPAASPRQSGCRPGRSREPARCSRPAPHRVQAPRRGPRDSAGITLPGGAHRGGRPAVGRHGRWLLGGVAGTGRGRRPAMLARGRPEAQAHRSACARADRRRSTTVTEGRPGTQPGDARPQVPAEVVNGKGRLPLRCACRALVCGAAGTDHAGELGFGQRMVDRLGGLGCHHNAVERSPASCWGLPPDLRAALLQVPWTGRSYERALTTARPSA